MKQIVIRWPAQTIFCIAQLNEVDCVEPKGEDIVGHVCTTPRISLTALPPTRDGSLRPDIEKTPGTGLAGIRAKTIPRDNL